MPWPSAGIRLRYGELLDGPARLLARFSLSKAPHEPCQQQITPQDVWHDAAVGLMMDAPRTCCRERLIDDDIAAAESGAGIVDRLTARRAAGRSRASR